MFQTKYDKLMKRIGLLTFFSFAMVVVSLFILAPLLAIGKYDPSGKIADDLNFETFNLLPVMFFGLMFICIGLLMLLPNKITSKAIITYVFGFPIILIGAGIFLLGAYFCLMYQPYIILGFALTILYLLIPKGTKFKYASEVKLTENSLDIINNKNQRISYSIPAISRVFLIGNFDGFVIETKSSRETYETKMKFSQLAQLFEPLKNRLFTLTAKLIGSARGKSIREIFGKEVNEKNFKIKTETERYERGRHTTRNHVYIPETDQWLEEDVFVWSYDYKNNNIIAKKKLGLFGIRFWSITLGYLILMYVGEKLIPLKQIN